MHTKWVYIYADADRAMFIGMTDEVGKILDDAQKTILYLCPFKKAFDAMAHKCLLEKLGKTSLQHLIEKNSQKTDIWIRQLKKPIQ